MELPPELATRRFYILWRYDSTFAHGCATGEFKSELQAMARILPALVQACRREVLLAQDWVEGHTGDVGNERADKLSKLAVEAGPLCSTSDAPASLLPAINHRWFCQDDQELLY